jgi:two-component sensor histidine kinase
MYAGCDERQKGGTCSRYFFNGKIILYLIMHRLVNRYLDLGIEAHNSQSEVRKIQATNLLNFVVALYMLISFTKYFILGDLFDPIPSSAFLALSLFSIALNAIRRTSAAFLVFSLNVNASVLFFNLYYPVGAGAYLFYFPLVVSVILLNNPNYKDRLTIFYSALFLICFMAHLLIDFPGMRLTGLSTGQLKSIWYYDLVLSVLVTGILSYLLVRLIISQSQEIVTQNTDLMKAKDALNNSLREKEILLAELHHRVKNNLAIMSSLLNLQIGSTSNEEAKQIISDSKDRISSMALVHRMLFENPELKKIDVGKYTSSLVNELFYSYNLSDKVTVIEDYDKIAVPVNKSVPIGLIMNEIVTNSIKYVYQGEFLSEAKFHVSIKVTSDNVATITTIDSGRGFPADFDFNSESSSLGIFLIKTLAEQIDGGVTFSNQGGAKIEVNFVCN